MKILIITNTLHNLNNSFNDSLPHLFGASQKLSTTCDVLIIGDNIKNAVSKLKQINFITQILSLEDSKLSHILPENIANQLAAIIKNNAYTHVMIAADSFGKNLLPRIAGILEVSQISEIVDIVNPNTFKKYIYAGNVLATIESLESIKLLTIRTISFPSVATSNDQNQASLQVNVSTEVTIAYDNPQHPGIKFISNHLDTTIDLSSAKVVVSGGKSLGSTEEFDSHIRKLAAKINAGVGATRAAVEAGYAPNDCQVGQTGKIIAPNVYIAIGISGAVQHIAGMKDSQTVIAINNDQTAPIFEYADYGLVADLFDIVPELISKL